MTGHLRDIFGAIFCLVSLIATAGGLSAADYPSRAIRLIVPFPPGGPTDFAARLYADYMSRDLGQAIVVEYRPGGNSVIGAEQVVRSRPDGYTLLFAMDTTLVMNPLTMENHPFKPLEDLTLISTAAFNTTLLDVRANGPKSIAELIARGKKNPNGLNYGTGLISSQIAGYLFANAAGFKATFVPYKGSVEVAQALLNGSIDFSLNGATNDLPLVKSGQVRVLAKLNNRPLPTLPDVKFIWDLANLPNYGEFSTWSGFAGPSGLARSAVERLRRSIEKAAADPGIKQKLNAVGIVAAGSTSDQFAKLVGEQTQRWTSIISKNGLKF